MAGCIGRTQILERAGDRGESGLLQTAARLRKPESRERICRRLEAMEASSSASSDMAPPRAHRFLLVGT
jgi:hypothetical protein